MKFFLSILFFLLSFSSSYGAFGTYNYRYGAINNAINVQKYNALKSKRNISPTRNIRYPNRYSAYPNIEKSSYQPVTKKYRYSSKYYEEKYSNTQE